MPQLIVNADDFGLTHLVNQAIVQAYQNGIVTSTTVMVNLPDAATGIEYAQTEAPELALGLHLNLTNGSPVCNVEHVSSLVDQNRQFYPIEQFADVGLQFDEDELYQELAAQVERFIELAGKLPSHMDAHYHVAFMHPAALEATLALAQEHLVPVRNALPSVESATDISTLQKFIPNLPTLLIETMLKMITEIQSRSPIPHTPAQFISRFSMPNNTLGDMLNILTDIGGTDDVFEIMCHPGFANDLGTTIGDSRQREFNVLCHPATREVIERFNIELTDFSKF